MDVPNKGDVAWAFLFRDVIWASRFGDLWSYHGANSASKWSGTPSKSYKILSLYINKGCHSEPTRGLVSVLGSRRMEGRDPLQTSIDDNLPLCKLMRTYRLSSCSKINGRDNAHNAGEAPIGGAFPFHSGMGKLGHRGETRDKACGCLVKNKGPNPARPYSAWETEMA